MKAYTGGCRCTDKIRCLCGLGKGIFPYSYLDKFEKLNKGLPPKEAFNDTFKSKSSEISDDDYERIKFIWNHYQMKTLKDLLIWYNNLDVGPFVKAIKEQAKLYKRYELDMFTDGLSLPGLAEKIMYQTSFSDLTIKQNHGEEFKFPNHKMNGYKFQDKIKNREYDMGLPHLNNILQDQNYSCSHCGCILHENDVSADRL